MSETVRIILFIIVFIVWSFWIGNEAYKSGKLWTYRRIHKDSDAMVHVEVEDTDGKISYYKLHLNGKDTLSEDEGKSHYGDSKHNIVAVHILKK